VVARVLVLGALQVAAAAAETTRPWVRGRVARAAQGG
jgi:hypothetical protein